MMRRFKVLLLTSKEFLKPGADMIGEGPTYPFGDNELEDYVELLSASNIPFDFKYHDDLSFADIISDGVVNYSTIFMSLSEKSMSNGTIDILKKTSHEFGVSIIAAYDRIGPKTMEFFGIDRVNCKRYRLPCVIAVDPTKVNDSKIGSEITFGDGWKITLQKWGFRRHPIRYMKLHLKKFWEQVFSYLKVEITTDTEVLAFIKGRLDPAILKYHYGKAVNYYISLQADHYLDRFNSMHRIIRELVNKNSGWGMVSINLENTMILRMDDPGSCERVYLKGYDTRILGKEDWHNILRLLKKNHAKLCIMYVPLWLDDANPKNGNLFIKGREITNRKEGMTYYSKDVIFIKRNGDNDNRTYDYHSEFLAIKEGIFMGCLDIESHGLTHVDTHVDRWYRARDRYKNLKWYHEFRHVHDNCDSRENEQSKLLKESAKAIKEVWDIIPTSVAPSGHEQSRNSERIAHDAGYKLFSSDYNTVIKNDMIIKNDKIKSVFFESTRVNSSITKAGYPIVGVFHDYEIVNRGLAWLDSGLNSWTKAGINRFMTFRELVGYLCSTIEACHKDNQIYLSVDISNTGGVSNQADSRYFYRHEMKIEVTLPEGKVPVDVTVDGVNITGFDYNKVKNEMTLKLPPFIEKDIQEIIVKCQSTNVYDSAGSEKKEISS